MAYISTDDVRMIRNKLKEEFGNTLKFNVRNSNKMKVIVVIKSGKIDFSDLLGEYDYCNVNHYYLENYGEYQEIFEKIERIIKTAPQRGWYNNSDIQRDYFDVSYYYDIRVGEYNRPYVKLA